MTTTTTSSTSLLTQGIWALDTDHTSVGFTIRHLGVAKVRGRFGDVAAQLVVGPTLDESSVTATIALGSIDTGNAERDAHLRGAELLDVEHRPTMHFRSTQIRQGEGSGWITDGDLTIGDVTKSLTFAMLGDVVKIELDLEFIEPA